MQNFSISMKYCTIDVQNGALDMQNTTSKCKTAPSTLKTVTPAVS
jgi:hypothetical protein